MTGKEYFNEFWNNKKQRNTVLVIVGIIIVAIAVTSYKGYNYAEKYLNKLEKEKEAEIAKYIKQRDSLKTVYQYEIDSIKNIKTDINNYYQDYVRERNKVNALQKKIDAIRYNSYTRKQLDSIAEHVKYK
jgi:GTP-binding protein EngB required for normal cell division